MSADEVARRLQGQLGRLRVPQRTDRVYKDECVLSFDTPANAPAGVFINLGTFLAYGEAHVRRDYERTGNVAYLNLRRVPLPKADVPDGPPEKRPKQLAIGGTDGFLVDTDQPTNMDVWSVRLMPDLYEVPLPDTQHCLPTLLQMVVDAVIAADSATKQEDVKAWVADKRVVSPIALSLQQLDNGVRIPPTGWKCANCDMTENLWLNLTDGTILCGRRNWDGSGGNGHALEHYNRTKNPLCVKLGTIDSSGHPDVYSYAEDDMVEDPLIAQHLKHFGIDMAAMSKTEKSIAELEIDQNLKFEFRLIQEAGKQLVPVAGPGLTGMENLGNSCYLSSVTQVLFALPPFQRRYFEPAEKILNQLPANPTESLNVQLAKLAVGLLSGRYSSTDTTGIAPRMFKNLIGKGHHEFSTMRQQDAMEFFQHLLSVVERQHRADDNAADDPSRVFKFDVEDRVQCLVSNKVSYKKRHDNHLSLPVLLEAAINRAEVEQFKTIPTEEAKKIPWDQWVRPIVPLQACLEAMAADELIPDFFSTATGAKGPASKTMRMATFPPYLMLHIRKFTTSADWTPVKIDVRIQVPDEIDLEWLRGCGQQPGEELLPETAPATAAAAPAVSQPAPDASLVAQLIEMGFAPEGCKKAAFHTQNRGVEEAMTWILEHMEDGDFAAPFVMPQASSAAPAAAAAAVDDGSVEMLMAMGFAREHAIKALKATDNNLERAGDWLLGRADMLDTMMDDAVAGAAGGPALFDGPGRYRLKAFISHMGPSTSSGHYVCHIRKEGRWVFFNDSKVALSEDPPREYAYLYLYERV